MHPCFVCLENANLLANLGIKGAVSSDTRDLRIADAEDDMHVYDWSRNEPVQPGRHRNAHWLRNPSSVSAIRAGIRLIGCLSAHRFACLMSGLKPLKAVR